MLIGKEEENTADAPGSSKLPAASLLTEAPGLYLTVLCANWRQSPVTTNYCLFVIKAFTVCRSQNVCS